MPGPLDQPSSPTRPARHAHVERRFRRPRRGVTALVGVALVGSLALAPDADAAGTPSPPPASGTASTTSASDASTAQASTPTPAATTSDTPTAPPSAPAAPPGTVTVTGTPRVGATLTAATEGWDPDLTLTYQWTVDGTPLAGATDPTLVVPASSLGKQVAVVVTSHRGDTTVDEVTSDPVGPVGPGVFTSAPTPTVTGTLRVGRVLTAVPGAWAPTATFTYQWRVNGVAVSGATGRTYTPVAADRTKRVSVTVTGSRAGFTPVSRTSAPTAVIDWGVFSAAPTPVVTGTPQIGSSVGIAAGTWSPGATLSYQWRIDGRPVAGATKWWLYLDAGRLGHRVDVVVTARRSGFLTVVRTSAARGPITRPFTTAPTPRIGGFFRRVGWPVTVATGTWGPTASVAVQWRRNGIAIPGATGRAYRPTTADLGKRLTVTVTGRRSGYTTTARTSAASPAVAPAPYGFTNAGTPATPPVAAYAPSAVKLMTDAQWAKVRANGVWRDGCPGYRTSFRRVEVPYWGLDGKTHRGWVNVNADVASSTARIFNTLYAKNFRMHRVEGIEMFGGWEWLGSKGNVSTALNCRKPSEQNSANSSSPHAWGRALDVNPVQNPYINPRTGTWDPNAPASASAPGAIRYGGLAWTVLRSYDWYWSGTDSWRDYMHFDTGYPSRPKAGYVVTPDGDELMHGSLA